MLPPDFKEFIERMIANHVRFVMIGGYAYNLYRNPRASGDIDFLVASDTENEARLRQLLTALRVANRILAGVELRLCLGLPTRSVRLQIAGDFSSQFMKSSFFATQDIESLRFFIPYALNASKNVPCLRFRSSYTGHRPRTTILARLFR